MKKLSLIIPMLLIGFVVFAQEAKIKEISAIGQKKFKKSAKRVYISDFRVNFQLLFSQTETAEGGREIGGGYRGDAKAGLTMGVKGLESNDLKEITNELYQYYTKQLATAGYEIISAEEASKADEYEDFEIKTGGTVNENQFPGLLSAVPDNFNYLIKKTTSKGKEKNKFNGYRLSSQLGGALVAKFNIDVLFVEDAESGVSKAAGKAVGGVAKIVVRPNLRIASGLSTYNEFYFAEEAIKPLSYTKMELKDAIVIPGVFEDKKYKAAESAQTELWGSSLGTMTVFNVSNKYLSKTIPLECDPSKYKNGVIDGAKKYIDAIFVMYNNY